MHVVIINGGPRAGKDTFVELCKKHTEAYGYSSVDFIKENVAPLFGWHGEKTPEARKFLSDLKDASTAYNDFSMRDLRETCEKLELSASKNAILFFFIREPSEISRAKREFCALTLLVKRETGEQISNHADADVEDFNYDVTVYNSGTLNDLDSMAQEFVRQVISGELEHRLECKA